MLVLILVSVLVLALVIVLALSSSKFLALRKALTSGGGHHAMNARAELGARQKGKRMQLYLLAAKRLPSVFFDSKSTILVMNFAGRNTEKEEKS